MCSHKFSRKGFALKNVWVTGRGIPKTIAQRGATLIRMGRPVLVAVKKCADCGHSVEVA